MKILQIDPVPFVAGTTRFISPHSKIASQNRLTVELATLGTFHLTRHHHGKNSFSAGMQDRQQQRREHDANQQPD